MYDNSVPLSRVLAFTLSAVGVLLVAVAWAIGAADNWHIGIMFGLTAVPVVAAAAVAWVRCYSLRICALLSATSHLRGEDGRMHSVH